MATDLGVAWRRFRRNKSALAGLCIIGALVVAAVLAPLITSHDPVGVDTAASRRPPSGAHWFGTDLLGRDVFTRVVYGARVSLRVGALSAAIAVVVGLVMGSLAGTYAGRFDAALMQATNVFLAFPYLLAALVIITVVGRGEAAVILVIGLLGWMHIARVLRSSILQVRDSEYVQAARAAGCGQVRIIVGHLLPNALQPVIVLAALFVGTAILSEAALSFLGVGITDPTPAWGLMLADGRRFVASSPHLLFFPGMAVFVTVLAFVLVGEGLRDALDPRSRPAGGERRPGWGARGADQPIC
ncbi:MAG TPA: ABC transporter permease [Acidimicrobiales bacterium]|nr:ABC transporter permease [Acidimicrobiales bacterium]